MTSRVSVVSNRSGIPQNLEEVRDLSSEDLSHFKVLSTLEEQNEAASVLGTTLSVDCFHEFFLPSIENFLKCFPAFKNCSQLQLGQLLQTITDEDFTAAVESFLDGDHQQGNNSYVACAILKMLTGKMVFAKSGVNSNIKALCETANKEDLPQYEKVQAICEQIKTADINAFQNPADMLDSNLELAFSFQNHNQEVISTHGLKKFVSQLQNEDCRKAFGMVLTGDITLRRFLEDRFIGNFYRSEKEIYERNRFFEWVLVAVAPISSFQFKGEENSSGTTGIWQKVPRSSLPEFLAALKEDM